MKTITQPSRFSRRVQGFTLPEILISLVIGLIILAGVFQLYMNSRQAQRSQRALTELQENGRTAITAMVSTLEKAGYRENSDSDSTTLFPTTAQFSEKASVSVINNDSTSGNNILDGSDALLLRYQANSNDNLMLDCIGNPLPVADFAWPNNVLPMLFAINDSHQLVCDIGATGSNPYLLATGAENLQLLLGVDSDADRTTDFYVTADQVSDFSQVVAVQLELLVRSDDHITLAPMSYYFNGQTTTDPGDRRMRMVFRNTAVLRNLP